MFSKIQSAMNDHEKKHPEQKEMNNIASKDLKGADGKIHPSKPLAMHVSFSLDGHPHNHPIYRENYDQLLLPDEKEILDDEALEIARLSSIVHDPEYVFAKQEPSEDAEYSRNITKHILGKHGPKEGKNQIIKHLFIPYMRQLFEKIHDDDTALHQLLPKNMTHRTPHKEDHYKDMMKSIALFPAFDGHVHNHWDKKIPKIFEKLTSGEYE